MPELPDVEGFRRLVEAHAEGQTIDDVIVHGARSVHNATASGAAVALRGRRIGHPTRHGKWLYVRTDGPTVMIHFRMTGALRWERSAATQPNGADRVAVVTGAGRLCYRDPRNLGGLWLAPGDADPQDITGVLGPDALHITRAEMAGLLGRSRRGLKSTLIDQSVIAGLGNMLSDEILWRAKLDPAQAARNLDGEEQADLHRALRQVLRVSVRAGHIPRGPTWLSGHRDDPDGRCPRALARRRIAGRTSLWCPHCQSGAPRRRSRGYRPDA
jgi:formamidopyrimidine-DNA glycosylase